MRSCVSPVMSDKRTLQVDSTCSKLADLAVTQLAVGVVVKVPCLEGVEGWLDVVYRYY